MHTTSFEGEARLVLRQTGVVIVVMGVSGTGKSTLGKALAKELGFPYIEGDDLHPKSNVDKMSRGIPLTDEDREPWLELIRTTAEEKIMEYPDGVVVTCSALKKYYRDILRGRTKQSSYENSLPEHPENVESGPTTYFVWINGSREVLETRLGKRQGHFFKSSLLDSQLETLETPEGEKCVVVVPLDLDTEGQVRIAAEGLSGLM